MQEFQNDDPIENAKNCDDEKRKIYFKGYDFCNEFMTSQ